MKKLITIVVLIVLVITDVLVSLAQGIFDPKSGETKFECKKFECNGTYVVNYQSYILNSNDSMKFRNEYTAQWKFRRLPVSFIEGDIIKLEFNCRVWDSDPNQGGQPSFALVKIVIPVPAQDRTITKQIELSNTVAGEIQPTTLVLPKNVINKDGSLDVSMIGKGWIEVKPTSLKVVLKLSNKPLKP